ncbi:hypothetical protein LR48_Vigan01g069100 [Vigna angularis]|uniref:Pentatricopeptide repeat-containing protein n=2 Tax=Phaseolus angularis TaxID=3914 RepID=A0A0L9TKY1_PHAAN|nr:pentatricopeptide repeat-containing protein At2g26790, mitochondrial [Vigna angularis]KAG2410079.1 Pentatricopeptide repeat-containing protein [Vigna angularis]KOM31136.1 hypothetical protein LR48_Vigan01g069100 [Vigna angularis]
MLFSIPCPWGLRVFNLVFKTIHKPNLRPFSQPFASTALAHSTPLSFSDTTPSTPLSHPTTLQVLQTLQCLHHHPSLALSFLNHLHRTGFPHTLSTYAAITKMFAFWNLPRKLDSLFLHLITLSKHHHLPFHLLQLFEILFQDFDHHNHYLLRAFGGFVKTCVSLNMFDEAIDFLFQTRRRGIVPDVLTCNFLFNRLVEQGEVDKALAIFEQLKRFGFRPNCYSYAIFIKALCKKGDLSQPLRVFEEMERVGITPHSYCYAAYIEGCCNNHRSALGYKVLQRFRKSNLPLEVYAYTAVIRGFCNEMKLDEAQSVFDDMERQGLVPDVFAYSALIQGYCKGNNPSKALVLHDKMISRSVKTNCFIVSYILNCLEKTGKTLEVVVDQFKKLKESGMFLDGVVYNIVFDALFKLGKVEDAISLSEDMKRRGVALDLKHYTTFIKGYCLQGDLVSGFRVFKEMIDEGFKPDIITYNVLVTGLVRNGHAYEALKFLQSEGVKPNSTTHKLIIENLCSVGKVLEAEAYFNSLQDKSFGIYSAMFNGYCETDFVKKSYKIFLELSNQGDMPNNASCFKLMAKLFMKGDTKKALMLMRRMLSNAKPNIIMYSQVIALLCNTGDMNKACSLFYFFLNEGLIPDVIIYTIMIQSYCRMNYLEEAHDLLQDMKRRGIKPDLITYTVLLDGNFKANLKSPVSHHGEGNKTSLKVFSIMRDIDQMEINPDVVFYTVLIARFMNTKDFKKALSVFGEMVDRGLEPDNITYAALGLHSTSHREKAIILLNEMGMTAAVCHLSSKTW